MTNSKRKFFLPVLLSLSLMAGWLNSVNAQYTIKWLSAGSLHNWYSAIGCEIEHGLYPSQQYGMRWPAIYQYQDMQAAKGFWIGAKDFTDEKGRLYPHKVVHVGPRVPGALEFYPIKMEMVSRFEPPVVYVDNNLSEGEALVENDRVDPDLLCDRMIINVANTQLGITMTRKIYQFSQEHHDNYHIFEFEFTNTGNVDADDEIELPNTTLEGVYFFHQWRWAVCREPRYVIGNGTGWGMNTMIDTRGDDVKADPAEENFRCQFAWHGKFPPFTLYDNVGAPVWDPTTSAGYISADDTTGRLAAAQFIGMITLHADTSPTDKTDDWNQPSTTMYESSDNLLTSNNDAYNLAKMSQEYEWMSYGHMDPRHADKVEPSGNFAEPTGDPALGSPGGFSAMNGYGPYTIKPGETVRIVFAEAANGLSREKCLEIGAMFKKGEIDAKEKNEWVLTSKDSLFKTFRRIAANFESGWSIPKPPKPPSVLNVSGRGDGIELSWDVYEENDPMIAGFEIYRAKGEYDSTYTLIYEAGPNERSYIETELERGPSYYYYIVSVGHADDNDGTALTPPGTLRSSRYFTQAYDPTTMKRPAGEKLSQIRVVPNPFSLGSDPNNLRFPGEPDKLAFFNIPGFCTIDIYTENGELVKSIEHDDGTGDEYWNCTTSSNQIVVSGVYIAVITDLKKNERHIEKFVIIR